MFAGGQFKRAGGFAHQFANGMLSQVALPAHLIQLRLGLGQLGLGAGEVDFRGNLAQITGAGQLQGLAVILQRAGHDALLRIQTVELHIQTGQLPLQTQASDRQIIGLRLRLCITGCHLIANFAPQVEVEIQREACCIAVVHRRLCRTP